MSDLQKNLVEFMKAYEKANNSHVWSNVEPFVADNATYWFTDGSFSGIEEIKDAVEGTFSKIQDEVYTISSLNWPIQSDSVAVCTYQFHWEGTIGGVRQSGSGRGTNVLTQINGRWNIRHEHLSS